MKLQEQILGVSELTRGRVNCPKLYDLRRLVRVLMAVAL